MKVLITGANGFVAPYLRRELQSSGHEIFLTGRESHCAHDSPYKAADLSKARDVQALLDWVRPDALIHLAGISHVAPQHEGQRADLITGVNVEATHLLLQNLEKQPQSSLFLFVSSGLVYQASQQGLHENSPLGPANDYGWTKLAAESLVHVYNSPHMRTYVVRPFNHTGPGQETRFVAPALAQRILETPNGGTIAVGNLDAIRDFSDVRDIVRAYRLILEKQPSERIFVLGSGEAIPIRRILDFFLQHAGKSFQIEASNQLLRTEQDIVLSKPDRARQVLGWQALIPFEQTLRDLYDHLESQTKL